ncbi:choice-of-anchor H family protein [Colwellia sp. 1_MG-2023]|uniref:choice-of-anchor H family protein n=1 Tax=Colwellia sp. 1_MG-2023 TaxID=3062649 RepID=UPI0026E3909B|nr:choice-of-anchor H family protein [Colwellia sp. 1_MG-2023]MDO6445903.1 choice-of-anchor H family protein [Colwellia sp. 1_MG-2023]
MNKTLTTAALLAIFSTSTVASESATNHQTTSVGSVKQTWQQTQAIEQLKTVESTLKNSFQGKTREQILSLKQQQVFKQTRPAQLASNNSAGNAQANTSSANNWYRSFNIYDGFSQLIEDYDEDGFYQTFSVTFDADVIDTYHIDQANVYAELYLSKNGGDWIHYYTTDIFTIYGESENDQYEVYTTLNQGYISDNYDVLIDLYEVGYSDIVASYSSDNTNALYALPLESSNYDPDYVEYHSESHGHGGSNSLFSLGFLISLLLIRKQLT